MVRPRDEFIRTEDQRSGNLHSPGHRPGGQASHANSPEQRTKGSAVCIAQANGLGSGCPARIPPPESRTEGPVVCIAQAIGLGGGGVRHESPPPESRAEGPVVCPTLLNCRAFSPNRFALRSDYPGRWPGLCKLPSLRPWGHVAGPSALTFCVAIQRPRPMAWAMQIAGPSVLGHKWRTFVPVQTNCRDGEPAYAD
ncbi:hypothetical protein Mal33_16280 [Rosistilla oblonga]|uniref:Uncharacterized protein n=1 Tax=Rosistilla oblonga TaxID=2527990 RepID=A0A518IRD8_9BACT|nr:hypothetical protein Mal33_16280 [Rosistilla oblonga]